MTDGRRYVDFEFTATSRGFTRHALASVTVGNGAPLAGQRQGPRRAAVRAAACGSARCDCVRPAACLHAASRAARAAPPALTPAALLAAPPPSPAGKFYTLVTGANEKRWGKMKDKVKTVVQSFVVEDRTAY